MDVKRLELLRELAERGSVAAVAQATHRTPSAVSQQLKVLEREAGVALTERVGRGIVLTGSGRVLAQTATDVAVALERAQAVWDDFIATPQGEVTLATFPTGGQMLLPGLLRTVAETPGLVVSSRATTTRRSVSSPNWPPTTTSSSRTRPTTSPGPAAGSSPSPCSPSPST